MEPFKNVFSHQLIEGMARHFMRVAADFDGAGFQEVASRNLEGHELKERSAQITKALHQFLPDDYPKAVDILLKSLRTEVTRYDGDKEISGWINEGITTTGIGGWAIMPMTDYVAEAGLHDFDRSMAALREMTRRFTAENAVRYFILEYPEKSMALMQEWAKDSCYHVRRLVSEGSRPRLPWNIQLKPFTVDPSPVLPLLEILKDDSEEYVRRSVANNLNDIAKDNPDVVAHVIGRWLDGADKNRMRLIKHACRTLIKQGHPATLEALGYKEAKVSLESLSLEPKVLDFGGTLQFEAVIQSEGSADQPLIIDYVIHHMKVDGSLAPKVFKWKVADLKAGKSLKAKKKHAIKPITTRKYYAGQHRLEVQVNGKVIGGTDFELVII